MRRDNGIDERKKIQHQIINSIIILVSETAKLPNEEL